MINIQTETAILTHVSTHSHTCQCHMCRSIWAIAYFPVELHTPNFYETVVPCSGIERVFSIIANFMIKKDNNLFQIPGVKIKEEPDAPESALQPNLSKPPLFHCEQCRAEFRCRERLTRHVTMVHSSRLTETG